MTIVIFESIPGNVTAAGSTQTCAAVSSVTVELAPSAENVLIDSAAVHNIVNKSRKFLFTKCSF